MQFVILKYDLQKKQSVRKPDSVLICHLSELSTPRHRTSSPQTPIYMRLQLAGRTAACLATDTGELLPHLLTLTPKLVRGGYFLLRLPYPHGYLPFRQCDALCCPDFPLFRFTKERQNNRLRCKEYVLLRVSKNGIGIRI